MFTERIKGHHEAGRAAQKKRPVFKEELFGFLQSKPKDKEAIAYFHVPYCDKICSFCSMNRSKLDGELDAYTQYLLEKIKQYANTPYIQQKQFESIYFGGGTPTILKTHQLEKILTCINESFNISPTCEFSFESTLHNLSLEKLKLMSSLGVNRYSIGIQTFSTKGRKLLNRTGDQKVAIEKLSKIKQNFDGLVCVDIIYDYPHQSVQEVLEDAKIAKQIGVDSASFYSLMFHDGSELSNCMKMEDYYTLEHDKNLHHAFLNSMLESDYEVLEYTKVNKIGKDKYKYIRLSHKGVDILPIGVGAGGRIGHYAGFTPKMGMEMFMPTDEIDTKLRLLGSIFQYPTIDLNEVKKLVNENTYNQIINFLLKAQSYEYLHVNENEVKYSIDGIFWGNTIAYNILQIALKEYA